MATVHLISGLPCSGKTTYATGLRADLDCALFSLDRWLITLFGQYDIPSVGHQEHTRRVLACRSLIWDSASELLRRTVDVVLDDGFFLRDDRARYAALAAAIEATARTHFVDTPMAVLRPRLSRRNRTLPRFNFHIDPATLQAFGNLFEAPSAAEGIDLVVIRDVNPPKGYDVQ